MRFDIEKNTFSDALSLIASVVPERSARAVLQNFLLTGNDDNSITLSATDLEIGMKLTLDVQNLQDPTSVLLPASRLNALIKGTYSDSLSVSIENNTANIKTKQGRFQVPGQDSEEYPVVSDFNPEGVVFIHGDDFADAIQKTVFATHKGDSRYALNGIFLSIDNTNIEFVASDTFRLSLVKKKIRNPDSVIADGILLTKGMLTLAKLAAGNDVVELALSSNELLARTPGATVVIRRVEGMFPRYQDVIPQKSELQFTVEREEFMRALHSIGLMSSEESRSVVLNAAETRLNISASSENGEGNIDLDAETSNPGIEIKFNFQLILDALKNISDEKITIQYKDSDCPARLDSGDFTYVIMPINR